MHFVSSADIFNSQLFLRVRHGLRGKKTSHILYIHISNIPVSNKKKKKKKMIAKISFFGGWEEIQVKKMISRKESEQIVTSTPLPAVTASPRTPPPPSLCMRGDRDFPWEAVRPRQEVRSRAERSGLRTWYRPCSVPTRRVTSSTTERSCCSSCSSWYSRGGPRTALPGREGGAEQSREAGEVASWCRGGENSHIRNTEGRKN